MSYIAKFIKEQGTIEHEDGSMIYYKVTPVFSEGEPPVGHIRRAHVSFTMTTVLS